jgi:hypothetical protein
MVEHQHKCSRTIASSEQEAASTPGLVPETDSRCLLSLTQAFDCSSPAIVPNTTEPACLALSHIVGAAMVRVLEESSSQVARLSFLARSIRFEALVIFDSGLR